MPFNDSFSEFYSEVKTSIKEETFAKLTLAKTIGNAELMNIYARLIVIENDLKLELKFKFQKEEIVEIHTIDKAFNRLVEFINNPFLSAILFTTERDLTYKLNKKRAISVNEQAPSFAHSSTAFMELKEGKKE
jgi:hypothetical protein